MNLPLIENLKILAVIQPQQTAATDLLALASEASFKIVFTASRRGEVPTVVWNSAHVVFWRETVTYRANALHDEKDLHKHPSACFAGYGNPLLQRFQILIDLLTVIGFAMLAAAGQISCADWLPVSGSLCSSLPPAFPNSDFNLSTGLGIC